MAFTLPLLNQVDDTGQGSHAEHAEPEQSQGGVEFQLPAEMRDTARQIDLGSRREREKIDQENDRRRERAEDRHSIGRAHDEIGENQRPGEESERFEEIGDGTMLDRLAALVEKDGVKNEGGGDQKKGAAIGHRTLGAQGIESPARAGQVAEISQTKPKPILHIDS